MGKMKMNVKIWNEENRTPPSLKLSTTNRITFPIRDYMNKINLTKAKYQYIIYYKQQRTFWFFGTVEN